MNRVLPPKVTIALLKFPPRVSSETPVSVFNKELSNELIFQLNFPLHTCFFIREYAPKFMRTHCWPLGFVFFEQRQSLVSQCQDNSAVNVYQTTNWYSTRRDILLHIEKRRWIWKKLNPSFSSFPRKTSQVAKIFFLEEENKVFL